VSEKYRLSLSKYSTHGVILRSLQKGWKVLDVGCNRGYLGQAAGEGFDFYGVDADPAAVTVAQTHYRAAHIVDLNKPSVLPWDIRFDAIIFADVLEHLLNPVATLGEFTKKYLKPDGIVVVSVPNIANWQIRLSLLAGRFEYQEIGILDRTHLHFYTRKTAQELCGEAGLSVRETYGGATLLGPIIRLMPFTLELYATNIVMVCQS
jgi:2-polyprenyl-3-methyl-5-hydroxy-6-metoxy-1,4-benzoquinol methylase